MKNRFQQKLSHLFAAALAPFLLQVFAPVLRGAQPSASEILSIGVESHGGYCLGECGGWGVTLHADGKFVFHRESGWGKGIKATGKIRKSTFAELSLRLESIHLFDFPDGGRCGPDAARTVVSVGTRGGVKNVVSCGARDECGEFVIAVDRLPELRRWAYKDVRQLRHEMTRKCWNLQKDGRLELDDAIWYDSADIIDVLAKAGFPVTSRDSYGTPFLMRAIEDDSLASARDLIWRGASLTETDKQGRNGAVEAGGASVAMIQLVLNAGAPVSTVDTQGQTMLMRAAEKGLVRMPSNF